MGPGGRKISERKASEVDSEGEEFYAFVTFTFLLLIGEKCL